VKKKSLAEARLSEIGVQKNYFFSLSSGFPFLTTSGSATAASAVGSTISARA
jgi:hypothetical protein